LRVFGYSGADASISRQQSGKGSRPRPSLHSSAAFLLTDDGRKTQLAWMGAKHHLGVLILLWSMRRGVAALHFFSDGHDCSSDFFTAQAILR